MLRTGEANALTPGAVRQAAQKIVEQEDPAYTQIWTQLSANQKRALKAVIASNGENLQSAAVTRAAGISTSSMQTALQALENDQLIRPEYRDGKLRYCLVDPCLGCWLSVV